RAVGLVGSIDLLDGVDTGHPDDRDGEGDEGEQGVELTGHERVTPGVDRRRRGRDRRVSRRRSAGEGARPMETGRLRAGDPRPRRGPVRAAEGWPRSTGSSRPASTRSQRSGWPWLARGRGTRRATADRFGARCLLSPRPRRYAETRGARE